MKKLKIAIVYGTRPEFIKLAPVVRACEAKGVDFFCIHTGQHYSFEMDEVFFDELALPKPKYRLDIGSRDIAGHGAIVGVMLGEIERILQKEQPDIVVVEGDTNSVLAGALAAKKILLDMGPTAVAHVEAGLRSYDRTMPEEMNRVVVDHISDILFTPTATQKNILVKEGIAEKHIFVVGNTIVDAVLWAGERSDKKSSILQTHGLSRNEYILATVHRQENVDVKERLENIMQSFEKVARSTTLPILLPLHPRTKKKLDEYKISVPKGVKVTDPLGYLDFVALEKSARLILTDSGGVQEETCILQVPCVTLRDSTERPETVSVGANIVAGVEPEHIVRCVDKMMESDRQWPNPFGNGDTGAQIVNILQEHFS